jgi:RNA polymerase sigma-32 factor
MSLPANLSFLPTERGFDLYLRQVKDTPSLTLEEEYMLAKRLIEHKDIQAAHKLINSHLKLVVKIALKYRGYGLSMVDLIAEGNLGLMQAVKKFDPELGHRLSTYAICWIKAFIQAYILKTWSLVKIGTTAAQKKLFFNLRTLKNKLLANTDRELSIDEYNTIADKLKVSSNDVKEMDLRLSKSDLSLNTIVLNEGEGELIDIIPETRPNQETSLSNLQEYNHRRSILHNALAKLNDRERDIITQRHLRDEPTTLETLSTQYNISAERVRQIEAKAFTKLQLEAQNSNNS